MTPRNTTPTRRFRACPCLPSAPELNRDGLVSRRATRIRSLGTWVVLIWIKLSMRANRLVWCIYPNQTALAEAPCGFPVHPRLTRHCSCWSAYCSCSLLSLHTHARVCRVSPPWTRLLPPVALTNIITWRVVTDEPQSPPPCAMRTATRMASRWIALCIPTSCHSWRPSLSHPLSVVPSTIAPLA